MWPRQTIRRALLLYAINAVAVIVGYVAIGLLIFGTDQLFAFEFENSNPLAPRPGWYYLVSVVTDTIYSIVGGWICASIAKTRIRATANVLVIVGELMGLASTFFLWNKVPHYYSFALLITYPLAVWFGSRSYEWTRPVTE